MFTFDIDKWDNVAFIYYICNVFFSSFIGDGRMDSPGFSAQYCTYTTMDNDSKEIISIVNIDKRET